MGPSWVKDSPEEEWQSTPVFNFKNPQTQELDGLQSIGLLSDNNEQLSTHNFIF